MISPDFDPDGGGNKVLGAAEVELVASVRRDVFLGLPDDRARVGAGADALVTQGDESVGRDGNKVVVGEQTGRAVGHGSDCDGRRM